MSEIKLLPCPFCGGEAELNLFLGNYCVTCTECMGAIFPARGMTEVEAIEAWNTRKPMQEIVKKLEEWKNSSQDSLEKCAFEKAIEIVKRGGVDEQID